MKEAICNSVAFAMMIAGAVALWYVTPAHAGNCQNSSGYYYSGNC